MPKPSRAARYGGEEIAILATHTPPGATMAVAERLRRDIEIGARKALREAQGARDAITVSMGLPGAKRVLRPVRFVRVGRKGLADGKGAGRNRVALAAS